MSRNVGSVRASFWEEEEEEVAWENNVIQGMSIESTL
jgi:hypothetical protein